MLILIYLIFPFWKLLSLGKNYLKYLLLKSHIREGRLGRIGTCRGESMPQDRTISKSWYTILCNIWACAIHHCFVSHKDLFQPSILKKKAKRKWFFCLFVCLYFCDKKNSMIYVQMLQELEVRVSWKFHMLLGIFLFGIRITIRYVVFYEKTEV